MQHYISVLETQITKLTYGLASVKGQLASDKVCLSTGVENERKELIMQCLDEVPIFEITHTESN